MEWFSTESYNISKNMNVLCKYGFFTSKIKCTVLFFLLNSTKGRSFMLGVFSFRNHYGKELSILTVERRILQKPVLLVLTSTHKRLGNF